MAGGLLSSVGLALSDLAARSGRRYVAGEPLTDALVWDRGNPTCFRLRPSTYMQVAMMLPEPAKPDGIFKTLSGIPYPAGQRDTGGLASHRLPRRRPGFRGRFGAFVGHTALTGSEGAMVDWRTADGKDLQPLDAAMPRLRR